MRLRTVLILALLVLVGVFAILNWSSFSAPTTLNFLVARIEAPLGILMLFAIGILAVVFLLMLARSEIAMLLESRRLTKELENLRKLAAEAEASRVESMRAAVLGELAGINQKLDAIAGKSGTGVSVT
jgi:uncharacterized integral membrane protein